jgi:hypothetical protein
VSFAATSVSKAEGTSDLGLSGSEALLISSGARAQATLTAAARPAGWNVRNTGQAVALALVVPMRADILTVGLGADMQRHPPGCRPSRIASTMSGASSPSEPRSAAGVRGGSWHDRGDGLVDVASQTAIDVAMAEADARFTSGSA